MTERSRLLRTSLPAGAISSTRSTSLDDGWHLCGVEPGTAADPADLPEDLTWRAAIVPGTVALALGPDGVDGHAPYDATDWWYKRTLDAPRDLAPSDRIRLRFDGLATLTRAWLNGEQVLDSTSMFCPREVDVTHLVRESNELVIAFRSLRAALTQRRPRPRWKTRLVEHQQLRWFRTTLLGRIPGWSPLVEPVGPWRPVWLEVVSGLDVEHLSVVPRLADGDGVVDVAMDLTRLEDGRELERATISIGAKTCELDVSRTPGGWRVSGTARVADPALWWPRTHGKPALHPCALSLHTTRGPITIDHGPIGFRSIEIDETDGNVRFVVNGLPVFCRGACWTSADIRSLGDDGGRMARMLRTVADANANMVRIGGTMVYESDEFYSECSRLGLMVWQDFMFANMDYPADDEAFVSSVRDEARQQTERIGRHACLVAFCGGSEVEQQAAMFGAPRELWTNEIFTKTLPEAVHDRAPGTPYWPSTPTGGVLPFHVGSGLTHYYGVGAYKRPLNDVRLANVRFTTECLGFSNVPEPENLRRLTSEGSVPPHHPAWKTGVPRDSGAGWDFEDIRDHYLSELYGVDPVSLRSEDPARYDRLSRVVTGRVMASVFGEWRSPQSVCGGGLVWFLSDLRPGAGWGVLDSDGRPKPAYYYLRRAWAPRSISLLDRGLDGVRIELHNELPEPLQGKLRVRMYGFNSSVIAEAERAAAVAARSTSAFELEELLGRFADPTYSYRFGPLPHAAITAELIGDHEGEPLSAMFWPALDRPPAVVDVSGHIDETGSGFVEATGLAMDVRLDLRGRTPEDNYFDLLPDSGRSFRSTAWHDPDADARGAVEATNAPTGARLVRRT